MSDARAFLDLPISKSAGAFRQAAEAVGMRVSDTPPGVTIHFMRGEVVIGAEDERTSLEIKAKDAVAGQLIRDTIADRVESLGLTMDWEIKLPEGRPANMSIGRVTGVRRISPSYTRVTFDGSDLARFDGGPLHFRVLLGPEGVDWPATDEGGVTQWPGGIEAWHRPVYTTRDILVRDDGSARIEFDVYLHDGGRMVEWTKTLEPGDEIAITGPTGGRKPPATGWIGLIGDETALPVIARILGGLGSTARGRAVIFVPDEGDRQEIDTPAGMTLDWVVRGEGVGPLDALRALEIPEEERFVFFAAEKSEVATARAYLTEQGLPKTAFTAASYWTA